MNRSSQAWFYTFLIILLINIFGFSFSNSINSKENNLLTNALNYDCQSLRNPLHDDVLNSLSQYDIINITLLSPLNNSIVNGGTEVHIIFTDENGTQVVPITELYRWDYDSNFESILRPLPYEDGQHILEVEVESESGEWAYTKFVFISDNNPPKINLISPLNKTVSKGGDDIILWESQYASGSLEPIDLGYVDNDDILDVIVGSLSGRIYTFNGRYGTPIYLTSQYSAPVKSLKVYNKSSIIMGLNDGAIRAINISTGDNLWSNSTINSKVIKIIEDNYTETLLILHKNLIRAFNYSGGFKWNVTLPVTYDLDFIFKKDLLGDPSNEVVVVNRSSFVSVYNISNGALLFNFSASAILEDALINSNYIYLSSSTGNISKYDTLTGNLIWSHIVASGQNIYDIDLIDNHIICSTGNGRLISTYTNNGSIIWNVQASSTYIKQILVTDFDMDTISEVLTADGSGIISNFNSLNGENNWNFTTSLSFNNLIHGDINGDTRDEVTIITNTGDVVTIDPRGNIPYGVPTWTNVSIEFDDEISDNVTVWEKYSWDGGTNQSNVGTIPSPNGLHTLEVWVCDNASNVAYSFFQFYSILEIKLNSPKNNSYQQSGTFINLTFSETPTEVLYKWDKDEFLPSLSNLPTAEQTHDLYIITRDQSQNERNFHFSFITDDTPIQSIILLSPVNDSIVEGGENIEIQFSETPFIEYYSWDGDENTTETSEIPISSDTHILTVAFADSAMNWKTSKYVFHTKIQISLDSPSNNSVINHTIILKFSFGENPDIYKYKINNEPYILFSDHNNTLNITLPSLSKTYTLTLRVNDSFNGRWNEERYVFVMKFSVNITSHVDGGYAETGDVLVIYFSDTPITRLFSWDGHKNSSRMPVVPAPDGAHYLDIYVGNIEGQFWHYHYNFNVDTDLIDILLISPSNNTRINSWGNITIEFSETPHIISYQWDNDSVTSNYSSIPKLDGGHILNVTVFDEASNENSKLFYWIIDDTPINITLNNTYNQSIIISGEYLDIHFNNETPYVEWYRWDDTGYSPVLPPDPPKNGTHTLNVTVSDGLNWVTNIYLFNITDFPPQIILNNSNIPYRTGTNLLLTINEDLTESWHRWENNSKIDGLSISVPNLNDGYHTLTIFAMDEGGSITNIDFLILIDNSALLISKITPSNNSRVQGGENLTITYTNDEIPYSVTYSWGSSWSDTLSPIPIDIEGKVTLNIRAYDEAGNLLDANIIYHIPSPEDKFAQDFFPLLIGGVLTAGVLGIVGFVKREALSTTFSKVKEKLKPPRRISD